MTRRRAACYRTALARAQGNKSAVFPLQLLGLEVDAINSVQFSNHTGALCPPPFSCGRAIAR